MDFRKIIRIFCYSILLLFVFLAVRKSYGVMSHDKAAPSGELIMLSGRWEAVTDNEYLFRIPADSKDIEALSLECFWSGVSVYLDKECIYVSEDAFHRKGVTRHIIALPGHSEGKNLILKTVETGSFFQQTLEGNSYLGAKDAVLLQFLKDNLYAFVFGLFSFSMALALFILDFFVKKQLSGGIYRAINNLAAFLLFAGIWVVSDSQLLQMFTDRTAVITLFSFLSFMAMPIFLILFVQEMLVVKRKSLSVLAWLHTGGIFIFLLRYLFTRTPMYQLLLLVHILIFTSIVCLLKNGISDIIKYKNDAMKTIIKGMGVFAVFIIGAFILFYRNLTFTYAYLYTIGILLFGICLAEAVLQRFHFYLERNARIVAYKHLALTILCHRWETGRRLWKCRQKKTLPGSRSASYLTSMT